MKLWSKHTKEDLPLLPRFHPAALYLRPYIHLGVIYKSFLSQELRLTQSCIHLCLQSSKHIKPTKEANSNNEHQPPATALMRSPSKRQQQRKRTLSNGSSGDASSSGYVPQGYLQEGHHLGPHPSAPVNTPELTSTCYQPHRSRGYHVRQEEEQETTLRPPTSSGYPSGAGGRRRGRSGSRKRRASTQNNRNNHWHHHQPRHRPAACHQYPAAASGSQGHLQDGYCHQAPGGPYDGQEEEPGSKRARGGSNDSNQQCNRWGSRAAAGASPEWGGLEGERGEELGGPCCRMDVLLSVGEVVRRNTLTDDECVSAYVEVSLGSL